MAQRAARLGPTRTAGVRSESVRRSNLAAILTSLHVAGSASRSELVTRTGLTRSAIGGLVGELAARDLVTETRAPSAGSPGRPSPVVSVRTADNVVVAIEFLVDSIAVAAIGLGGSVIRLERAARPRDHASADEVIDKVASMVAPIVAGLPPTTRVHGIGVAVAGIVRRDDNLLMFAPNLGWHDAPIGSMISAATGLPYPVVVGNDGDLGALAERRRGAGRGMRDLVYVTSEVGVGGGIISSDQRLTGPFGFAGEVGHMVVNPEGQRCGCGAIGCWETEVGEDALLRRAGLDPTDGAIAVERLVGAFERGEPDAMQALSAEAHWLGIGIASLINLFSPTRVVLGGLLHRIFPYVSEGIHRELDERTLAAARSGVTVTAAELGLNAPLVGAAELAWQPVLDDPGAIAVG